MSAPPPGSSADTRAYPDLKGSDRVREECGRCGGAGSVAWGVPVSGVVVENGVQREVGKVCFECNGLGYRSVLVSSIRARAARARRAAAAAEARAAAHAAEQAAAAAELEATRAAWVADHADVVDALATLTGDFAIDMRDRLDTVGSLTDRQAEAVLRIAREAATAAPVVEGRVVITGTLQAVRYQEPYAYGGTGAYKGRIRDDRGFTVWGTLPGAITDALYGRYLAALDADGRSRHDDGRDVWTTVARGARVTLTATVEASRDDATFGYYKRPSKAALID